MEAGLKNKDKFFYGWVIVIVGLIDMAVLIGSRQSYGVFFKSIESDFGLSRMATSGIFSVFMAFSGVFAALGGWALDKFGPKWTLAAMGFFTGLSLLITSQMHSVWQLYLTYSFIMAIGTGETYTVVVSSVSRWFQKKRGLALGISSAGGGVGPLIIAPFATYLIINFDWHTAYIVMGVIALVVVISLSMLLKGYPSDIGLLPDGVKPDKTNNSVEDKKAARLVGSSLREAIKTKQFWSIFMVWMFQGTAVYVITTHIVPHVTDVGISDMVAATIISVLSVFNIIGGLTVGALSDTFGRKTMSIVSALISAGALFWLMWMPNNIWLFYVFAALFGIAWGGISTVTSALAGDTFGVGNIGKIMGLIGLAWFIGAAIGPLIAGTIFDIYKSYFLAFLMGAICMLIVTLFLAMLSKPRATVTHEPPREKN
jgi:MFS family permease